MKKLVDIRNLSQSMPVPGGRTPLCRGLSFDVNEGEIVALVGRSDATSALLRAIAAKDDTSFAEGGAIVRHVRPALLPAEAMPMFDGVTRIEKQMRERVLAHDASRAEGGRRELDAYLARLREESDGAAGEGNSALTQDVRRVLSRLANVAARATEAEESYVLSHTSACTALACADRLFACLHDGDRKGARALVVRLRTLLEGVTDRYLLGGDADLPARLDRSIADALVADRHADTPEALTHALSEASAKLTVLTGAKAPDFFTLAFDGERENFTDEFVELVIEGVRRSFAASLRAKRELVTLLSGEARNIFGADFDRAAAKHVFALLLPVAQATADRLSPEGGVSLDALTAAVDAYLYYKDNNARENARYERDRKRLDVALSRGKELPEVYANASRDPGELLRAVRDEIDRLAEDVIEDVERAGEVDFRARTKDVLSYVGTLASRAAHRSSRRTADEEAYAHLTAAGVPDAPAFAHRYPFELGTSDAHRLPIAAANVDGAELVLRENPTENERNVFAKLRRARGLAVLFTTEDEDVAARVADRVISLEK